MGKLTTHVLDTAHGCPAANVQIELWRIAASGERIWVSAIATNADGRTDQPLLMDEAFQPGTYELVFAVGDYFARYGESVGRFLDRVPIQFHIADTMQH
jgi:5-hydroxyisourate hydrolase